MNICVNDIYSAALAIMGEETSAEYEARTPGIVNALIGRCFQASERYETGPHSMWTPVGALTDAVCDLDRTLALSAMPYGLAALLYLDEDPARSSSWWSIFLEQVELCRRSPAEFEPVENVYGAPETNFGRW